MNPADPYQHIQDHNHVRLLAIFHCVYGGLCALCGIGLIVLAVILMSVFSSVMSTVTAAPGWATTSTHATTISHGTGSPPLLVPSSTTATTTGSFATTTGTHATTGFPSHGGPPPRVALDTMDKFMKIYALLYAAAGLLVLAFGILSFISAYKMMKRQAHTFSLVVAGLNCLSIPLGTTLGVFTFVVLLRPSVAAEYEQKATAP